MQLLRSLLPLIAASLITFSPGSLGQVFKCVDEATGKMTFTDTACPDKGTGDYIPVAPTNADSGYSSGKEIAVNQREREARRALEEANVNKWVRNAEDAAEQGRVADQKKKADRLYDQAQWEKDPTKRSSLLRQAEAQQRASAAAEQGNTSAEKHYEKAGEYFEDAKNSRDLSEKSSNTRRGLAEQEAGRAAQGLPPLPPPEPSGEKAVPSAVQPSVITNCDTAGCGDNIGNRYSKGAGQTYIRSDGKACQAVGGSMHCN